MLESSIRSEGTESIVMPTLVPTRRKDLDRRLESASDPTSEHLFLALLGCQLRKVKGSLLPASLLFEMMAAIASNDALNVFNSMENDFGTVPNVLFWREV